ncbi:MAG TPA: cobyric acid synthase [Acidimicrobiales bacterium]|nr:cobyric acid synthase [Acidimicrobiales bacterium]
MGSGLLVAGATSDAGKSLVVAGLCRLLARRGVSVAPFKAQNMSLNSAVTADGAEIGRAQAFQALCAGVEPTAEMNPILLKPTGPRRSQVVVLGRAVRDVDAGEYGSVAPTLWPVVLDSLSSLRSSFDVVVCEGAGGAAEVNLLERDVVNLPLAARAGMPAIVVGDIERGGVFASLYGTWALVPPALQATIRGFVINRLRGDPALLGDGCATLTARTGGVPVLGVLPHVDGLQVDDEDSLALHAGWATSGDRYDVAVVRFPHVSNVTDLDPLRAEPGVSVRLVTSPADLASPDLVVLPGTKATVADLAWLRSSGLVEAIAASRARVLGICGGYQMMGRWIDDPVESGAGRVDGLGWLDVTTTFEPEKVLRRRAWGYEIHHGRVADDSASFVRDEGRCLGTTVHGLFDDDAFRHSFLGWASGVVYADVRAAQADALADLLEQHLDVDATLSLLS